MLRDESDSARRERYLETRVMLREEIGALK